MSNPSSEPNASEPFIEFGPSRGWHLFDFAEIWRFRELMWILALRDLKVRYKQTLIGAAWAIVRPVMYMIVFTILFRLLKKVPVANDELYPIIFFAAMLPWQLFASAVTQSSSSIVANQNLVRRTYFPRAILPIAPLFTALADFAVAFLVLIGMMIYYEMAPTWAILTLPLWIGLALLVAAAIGIWMSALSAMYRDFSIVIPFMIQIGFFVSPVVFETGELIPSQWHTLFSLNPMVGVIEGFRWAILTDAAPPQPAMIISSVVITLVALITGMLYFRRMESTLVDWV